MTQSRLSRGLMAASPSPIAGASQVMYPLTCVNAREQGHGLEIRRPPRDDVPGDDLGAQGGVQGGRRLLRQPAQRRLKGVTPSGHQPPAVVTVDTPRSSPERQAVLRGL